MDSLQIRLDTPSLTWYKLLLRREGGKPAHVMFRFLDGVTQEELKDYLRSKFFIADKEIEAIIPTDVSVCWDFQEL